MLTFGVVHLAAILTSIVMDYSAICLLLCKRRQARFLERHLRRAFQALARTSIWLVCRFAAPPVLKHICFRTFPYPLTRGLLVSRATPVRPDLIVTTAKKDMTALRRFRRRKSLCSKGPNIMDFAKKTHHVMMGMGTWTVCPFWTHIQPSCTLSV